MSNFASAKVTAPDQPFAPLVDPQPDWNYEATVAEVEAILAKIEGGQLDLADVFEKFSTAVEYLRQCEAFLGDRQKQVDLLIETLTDEPEF
jgi:exodeoxyribonuclease VII small subunit